VLLCNTLKEFGLRERQGKSTGRLCFFILASVCVCVCAFNSNNIFRFSSKSNNNSNNDNISIASLSLLHLLYMYGFWRSSGENHFIGEVGKERDIKDIPYLIRRIFSPSLS